MMGEFEQERLDVLIGRWKTVGWTRGAPGAPRARIDAVDTYERLPGGALLHRVDARVGEEKVEGAEIIGYDPHARCSSRSTSGATDQARTRPA